MKDEANDLILAYKKAEKVEWKNEKGEYRRLTDNFFILQKDNKEIVIDNPQLTHMHSAIVYGDIKKDEYINLKKLDKGTAERITRWFLDRDAEYHCPKCGSGIDSWRAVSVFKKFECHCGYVAFVGSSYKNKGQVTIPGSPDERREAYVKEVSWVSCEDENGKPVKPPIGLTVKIGY